MSFHNEYVSWDGDKKLRALTLFGAAWGLQRNYQKRFALDLNVGLGYVAGKKTTIDDDGQYITQNVGEFTSLAQIGLGFWLNRRN